MLSARHWDVTKLTKPIRPLSTPAFLLMGLAALAACSNPPPHSAGRNVEALVATPPPPSAALPAPGAAGASEASVVATDAAVEKLDPPALTDHSFVSPLPPDLFLRLRAGFK